MNTNNITFFQKVHAKAHSLRLNTKLFIKKKHFPSNKTQGILKNVVYVLDKKIKNNIKMNKSM